MTSPQHCKGIHGFDDFKIRIALDHIACVTNASPIFNRPSGGGATVMKGNCSSWENQSAPTFPIRLQTIITVIAVNEHKIEIQTSSGIELVCSLRANCAHPDHRANGDFDTSL